MQSEKSSKNVRIVVLGGYGSMGRIIVRDLSAFAKQVEIVIAGRDEK